MGRIKIHKSAFKHDISAEDAICAAEYPIWVEDLDDNCPARQLRLGFDTQGRLLETVVLTFDSGNDLVIHAMKIRQSYLELIPPNLLL